MNEPAFIILRKSNMGLSLRKRRTWYDDQPPADTPPPDDKGGASGSKPPSDKPPADKTFTQADLDAIVSNERKQTRKASVEELVKKLGLGSEDELARLVGEHKQAKEAALTEQQKLAQRAEAAETRAQELEQKLKDEQAARRNDLLNMEVKLAAKDANAMHPEDVWTWLRTNRADDLDKVIGDDGKVNTKAIEGLIGAAKEARPNFFEDKKRFTPGSPSNSGGRVPEPNAKEKDAAARAQAQNLRNRF